MRGEYYEGDREFYHPRHPAILVGILASVDMGDSRPSFCEV